MKAKILAILFLTISLPAIAQKDRMITSRSRPENKVHRKIPDRKLFTGVGFGLDYNGIGLKFEYMPVPYIGAFASFGTNFFGGGYNLGAIVRPLPYSRVTPFLIGMYGYNGVLIIKGFNNDIISSKNYFGLSVGGGAEFVLGKNGNRLGLGLFVPIRSQEFQDEASAANAKMSSIAFSVSFKFGIL